MNSDWRNNNRDDSYNRYDDQDRRYQRNDYSDDQFNDFPDEFGDRNNRDVYEYRDRRDRGDYRERTTFSPDPEPRDYGDKQLGGHNQFKGMFKNLFQREENQQSRPTEYQHLQQEPTQEIKNFVIYSPKTYTDIKKLIDFLRNGQPIIVNLSTVKQEKGQRILDFLSGAIYALGGKSHKISASIWLLTPNGVNIMVPTDLMEQIKKDND